MPFRRRPADYGRVLPSHRWQGLSRGTRFWRAFRPWMFTGILVALGWYFARPAFDPKPEPPSATSEKITGPFTLCGQGRSTNCVVDGDTVKLGARTVRVMGIDAPEIHPPRCPAEEQLGKAARDHLLALVNQGPFYLTGPVPPVRDEYGRELHNLVRSRPDGSVQSLGDDMVASGKARSFVRGPRDPWC